MSLKTRDLRAASGNALTYTHSRRESAPLAGKPFGCCPVGLRVLQETHHERTLLTHPHVLGDSSDTGARCDKRNPDPASAEASLLVLTSTRVHPSLCWEHRAAPPGYR